MNIDPHAAGWPAKQMIKLFVKIIEKSIFFMSCHFVKCKNDPKAACGSIFMSSFQSEGKCSPISNYSGHYQRPTNFAQPTQQRIHQKCGRQGFLFLSGRRDSNTRHPMEKGKNIYITFNKVCSDFLFLIEAHFAAKIFLKFDSNGLEVQDII